MEKTMVELFAGVGGFRLGMEALDSGWETVWFSQWEPDKKKQWAHDCYVAHFGDSMDLDGRTDRTGEDISQMPKDKIPDHTLLVGGFPCLTGDSLVLTKRGYIPIVNVKVGDEVLSHDKNWHKVVSISERGEKQVFKLKAYGLDELRLTENHRLLVRDKTAKTIKENKKSVRKTFIWNFARKPLPSLWEGMNGFSRAVLSICTKKVS